MKRMLSLSLAALLAAGLTGCGEEEEPVIEDPAIEHGAEPVEPIEPNGLEPAQPNGLEPAEPNGFEPAEPNGLEPAEPNGFDAGRADRPGQPGAPGAGQQQPQRGQPGQQPQPGQQSPGGLIQEGDAELPTVRPADPQTQDGQAGQQKGQGGQQQNQDGQAGGQQGQAEGQDQGLPQAVQKKSVEDLPNQDEGEQQ